jgi:hypothetical protein
VKSRQQLGGSEGDNTYFIRALNQALKSASFVNV